MSPRGSSRVISCTPAETRARREQAKAFIDVAEMVLSEPATQTDPHVAAALAVLAAIAATDAICGLRLVATAEARTTTTPRLCWKSSTCPTTPCQPSYDESLRPRTTCITPHGSSPRPTLKHSCDTPAS